MNDRILNIDDIRERIARSGYETAKAFRQEFGDRAPDQKTLEIVYDPKKKPSAKFAEKTLRSIDNCLLVPQNQYKPYQALRYNFGISELHEEDARKLFGSYVYYRPNSRGEIVNGGLHLFENHGVLRFYHFRKVRYLERYRESKKYPKQKHMRPTHQGFYFCKDGRIYFLGIDDTYIRLVMAVNYNDLSSSYVYALVLTRDDNDAVFSAKCFMIHESNREKYDSDFGEDKVCEILGIKEPKDGILTIKT